MSNVNGVLLRHLFQLAEGDNQDAKTEKLLSDTIRDIRFQYNKVILSFTNDIEVVIVRVFDSFNIYISDIKMYSNDDDSFTSIGSDRVLWYLKNIAQFKYDWRKKW
jgi:hypothetical protein